jgi:uncharacterized protein YegL
MPSVPFSKDWCIKTAPAFGVATSDIQVFFFTRRAGAGGAFIAGGQTGFAAADFARYVDSRALRPHTDKGYEGASSPPSTLDPPVVSAMARGMRVLEESEASFPDERAVVPAGVSLHLRFEAPLLQFGAATEGGQSGGAGGTAPGGWSYRLLDASSGAQLTAGVLTVPLVAPVSQGADATWEVTISAATLGGAGRRLLWWVSASGAQKSFLWPPDYTTITGSKELKPKIYAWQHPTLGTLYFDPVYRIGALPYDRSDSVQAALLEASEAAAAAGKTVARTQWADYLLIFNPDGTVVSAGGEWSCLKIQSAATWLDDAAVPFDACSGVAVWTATEPTSPGEEGSEDEQGSGANSGGALLTGTPTPLQIEPRLRSVRAFEEGANGEFWMTGSLATRNGRQTALLRVDTNWRVTAIASADPFAFAEAPSKAKSRLLMSSIDGRRVRFGSEGEAYVLTLAGELRFSGNGFRTVEWAGVGGRAGARLERLDGMSIATHLVDPDLAKSAAYARFGVPTGAGHVVSNVSPYPGPLLAKVVDGAVGAHGTFFGVVQHTGKEITKRPSEESDKEPLDDQQGIARWTVDGIEVLQWWKATRYDMSRVIAWPGGVYVFGFNDQLVPRAHRLSLAGDGVLEMGLQLPYLVLNGECGLSMDGQSECLRIVGRKFFGRKPLAGWYCAEGTVGNRGGGGLSVGSGAPQIDFTWGEMGFSITRAACLAGGFAIEAFPPFLRWSPSGACWLACASQPIMDDGEALVPYLVFDGSGDPLRYTPGAGVVLPQNTGKWGGLRFTSGTCQGVMSRRLIPDPNCGKMDVALVVDTTGSMGGALNNVSQELSQIVEDVRVASGGNYRLSLVTFKDIVEVLVPFADQNADEITPVLLGLKPEGGNNEPEASDEAILTCVLARKASDLSGEHAGKQVGDFAPWRGDARRIVIMVTDARPGGFTDAFNQDVEDGAATVANLAAQAGVLISAIFVPRGDERTITRVMEAYADITGGLFSRTAGNGQGVAAAISDVINSCGGNMVEEYVEYCTEDVVVPVPTCGDARCALENHDAGENVRVGVFQIETTGPQHMIFLQEHSNPEAFATMCRESPCLWARLDGSHPIALSPGGTLSATDLNALAEFNLPISALRDEVLPRYAHRVEVAILVSGGVGLEVSLEAVH